MVPTLMAWRQLIARSVRRQDLEASDLLQTFAEVGIGLAGFTGIVAALQSRSGEVGSELAYLIGYSIGSVLFALLPLLLMLALPSSASWRIASALLFTAGAVAFVPYWLPGSRLRPEVVPRRDLVGAVVMALLLVALGAVVAGVVEQQAPFTYAAAVFFSLAMSFAAFVRILGGRAPAA